MKKSVVLLVLLSLVFVFAISTVSAAGAGDAFRPLVDMVSGLINTIIDTAKPFLEAIVGDVNAPAGASGVSSGDIFFAKVLLLILIVSVVFAVLENVSFFSSNSLVLWIVSIIVSILGVRFLSAELVWTIILPYSVFGVAVSAGIPFAIYFIFVEKGLAGPGHHVSRRAAWVFFIVVFLAIYFLRFDEIPNYAWIYPGTAVLAFLVLWFDGTIQKFFLNIQMQKVGAQNKQELIDKYKLKVAELPQLVAAGAITTADADKRKREYQKKIAHWMK
ncbi:hypothetical protein J4217_00320 [Candidatus Pacearchaeota archaeon]|nr:hypothetical protein [Candidatus Pacearchaeota archaeon]